jgi:hypothetical protein
MAIGERVLLPAVRNAGERTLIVADGFSCREQIAQTTGREALHTAELLHAGIFGPRSPFGTPRAAGMPSSSHGRRLTRRRPEHAAAHRPRMRG